MNIQETQECREAKDKFYQSKKRFDSIILLGKEAVEKSNSHFSKITDLLDSMDDRDTLDNLCEQYKAIKRVLSAKIPKSVKDSYDYDNCMNNMKKAKTKKELSKNLDRVVEVEQTMTKSGQELMELEKQMISIKRTIYTHLAQHGKLSEEFLARKREIEEKLEDHV